MFFKKMAYFGQGGHGNRYRDHCPGILHWVREDQTQFLSFFLWKTSKHTRERLGQEKHVYPPPCFSDLYFVHPVPSSPTSSAVLFRKYCSTGQWTVHHTPVILLPFLNLCSGVGTQRAVRCSCVRAGRRGGGYKDQIYIVPLSQSSCG